MRKSAFSLSFLSILVWCGLVFSIESSCRGDQVPKGEESVLMVLRPQVDSVYVGRLERFMGVPRVEPHEIQGKRGPRRSGTTLTLGGSVFEQDRFINDEKTRTHLRLRDRTYVELGASSEFALERIRRGSEQKQESVFRFFRGLVRVTAVGVEPYVHFYVKHGERVFKVEGPSDFYLEVNPKNFDLVVTLRKGALRYISSMNNEGFSISSGQIRRIQANGTVLDGGTWSEEKAASFGERLRTD